MTDSRDGGLFSFSQKANYWNDLYECPSTLFEHVMVKRRDYAFRYVCRHFDTDARVLDLGCGAGVFSEKLIRSGFTVTAADASPDMLELSRKRLQHLPPESCRLVHANCLHLPFPDGEFDLVVCLGMFGYFDEATQALREIRRVLQPGGTLFISTRNVYSHYVFDLLQLAALPLRLARALVRRLGAVTRETNPPRHEWTQWDDGFRIQIYQNPARLIDGVIRRGYVLTKFDGLGYGPLTFAGRKLLSVKVSVQLSDYLEQVFRRTGLNRLTRWLADVGFYVFQRKG